MSQFSNLLSLKIETLIENWKLLIENFMKRFIALWLPVIIWMAVIFYLSSLPDLRSNFPQKWDTLLRKIAHVTEYALLTILLLRALKGNFPALSAKRILILAFLFALLYASSDEFHQLFVFGREGTIRDVSIDTVGIILSTFASISKNKVAKKLATHLGISS